MLKKGFTLSEVLITLAIIGIVAAMTIPSLMQSIQDKDRRVAYNKSVAIISEATQQLAAKDIGCGTIVDNESLARCLANVFISGTLTDNTLLVSDGQAYTFFWRKGEAGTYSDCGEFPLDTEDNWKGRDANCVVVIDINGPNKGSIGNDDYSAKIAITAPSGIDHFPMILTSHSVRPAYYENSLGYEYSFGREATADEKPWEAAEELRNQVQNNVNNP